MVSLEEKLKCLELLDKGYNSRRIYEEYYRDLYPETKYRSFTVTLSRWKSKYLNSADKETLRQGTYPNFEAHGATVQINKSGEVVQAWIKQSNKGIDIEELLESIKEHTTPVLVNPKDYPSTANMLEIPLYDMHFPMSEYKEVMEDIIYIITKKRYDEINIILGQDMFHNDDFRGRTSSGRYIERVDIVKAWKMAEEFWYNIIYYSLEYSNRVNLIYSKGNHDESLSWAFVQELACMFPELSVDDSLKHRKCIHWNGCFIGITHGHTKKNSDFRSLRSQFTIEYPKQFADSSVREIHAGHLHHEESGDIYGVTIRRLSSAVPTDEWSDNEGYVGAHKRFMLFEWEPHRLNSIHFIY